MTLENGKAMNILLISPCIAPDEETPKELMIPQLALHILEGLTPADHTVKIVEEELERVNLDEAWDLVGISCLTSNAPRGYHLAAEFRKRGALVVLGGVHPTLLPDEAARFADAVVIGEAESVWESVVADAARGQLKRFYQQKPDLERYIPKRYVHTGKKTLFNAIPVMTTRGCPYACEFCCVSRIYGKTIRHVPVDNVVRDIEESGGKIYIFLDDNIIAKTRYAKSLFRAIKPLKIRWVGQASISFVHDAELMRLARDSGCAGLFFGLESVSETQLRRMKKSIKEVAAIEEAIRKIKGMGIHFHASLVFGFDNDTQRTFPETLDFLQRNKIGTASFNILTPYPGTPIHERFLREGRLLSTDWKHYDHSTVVFEPKNMTPYELQAGTMWIKKRFTTVPSILRRLPGNLHHPLLYLAMNWGLRSTVKSDPERLAGLQAGLFGSRQPVPAQALPNAAEAAVDS